MLEILGQFFWWSVLVISVPCLVAGVIAFPVMCEIEKYKEANKE